MWHALSGTGTIPGFAIGQRALLVQTPQGNLLWAGMTLIRDGGHYAGAHCCTGSPGPTARVFC